jgi:hypothetical protein
MGAALEFSMQLMCRDLFLFITSVYDSLVEVSVFEALITWFRSQQVFLIKHYRNLREDHEDFVLDFETIYVIDSASKSIAKADVKVQGMHI